MINKDNLKDLLRALNFEEKGNMFSKYFTDTDAYLKVDFKKNELIYPTDKGFVVNGEFTCNFSSDENFVVFECVNRLFEKGYKPEHIELEPKWKVGHGASGGRADILVKDNSGKSLLIIECKTEGTEFKKEWNNTLQRGGQMLTYAKQAGTTQYVCLYASDFADGKVVYFSNIISLNDNEKLLQELADKKPLSFKEAKALEVEDIYRAWKETYNLDFATKGIFEDDIQAYHIGKQKYTIDDLVEIGSKDIQSKYHEFATIMRQHNVSGRENAFDKLVNLFLCKIVDEAKNPKDLKFNWKGIAYDSYFDLQDRLQLLYQAGMKEFLGEQVTYIDNNAIDKAFRFFKKDPDATRETIKKYFRELKFFTNNDFAFIDVHNEKLFYQNSEVLLKIVQMLQDTRLQSETQNQFLGDMFEGFLDNGVKQSEGQFFTPMPIVKFILNSLPLESIIKESELPPKAIDYACGAGHFLNELASQIKPFVEKHKETDVKEYYKEIIGIEKEYRLSKVAKVSAFMYGQDNIKITYADALGSKAKLQDNEFSILVANPPYAVKGFLQTLSETERKAYTLFSSLDEKSMANNNSIETFFIERAKQLLKPGAVAGIILPSSILSNDATIYTNTREILLKYFQIVAIAEFGSQTFGKTGTTTVTLFLRRKEENPAPADHWKYRVDAWFTDNEADVVYNDSIYIKNYCNHIEVDESEYKTLLKGNPSNELIATELFSDYKKAFDNLTEIKNLQKQKSFKAKTKSEQDTELRKRFTDFLTNIEKDKLYFYVLASENKSKVLVVKSPIENKEQKQFLGYEWSSAKGNEGIKYINQNFSAPEIEDAETKEMLQRTQGLHNINTPLYNPHNTSDDTKINQYIKRNFEGNELAVIEALSQYVSYYNLVDMLDFSRINFTKQISLAPKRNTIVQSKWDLVKIESYCSVNSGGTPSRNTNEYWEKGTIPWLKSEVCKGGFVIEENLEYITELGLKKSNAKYFEKGTTLIALVGATKGKVGLLTFKATTNQNVAGIYSNDEKKLLNTYLFYSLLNMYEVLVSGLSQYDMLNLTHIKNIKIPLPPLDIQKKIADECLKVDNEATSAEKLISSSISTIEEKLKALSSKANKKFKLSNDEHFEVFIGRRVLAKDIDTNSQNGIPVYSANVFQPFGFINKSLIQNFDSGSILWGIDGDWMVNTIMPNIPFYPTDHCGVIRIKSKEINYKYLAWALKIEGEKARFSRANRASTDRIKGITIDVPPIKEQDKIISEIEELEKTIRLEQIKIDNSADKKKEIIKKYL
jgi:type I restriction-modification system DNA methylase subunit